MASRVGSLLFLSVWAVGCTSKETPPPPAATLASITPTVAPTAPPAPVAPLRPMRVMVGGDLLPHRPSLAEPKAIREALAPLGPTFKQADAVIANFEAATGDVERSTQRMAYGATPEWLAELPKAGIKAISVANNHACDLGDAGLDATLATAAKNGLTAIGGDANGDPWAPRVVATSGGKKVCAVAWTTIVNAQNTCAKSPHLAVAPPVLSSKPRIDRALRRARSECDAIVAILHGGDEYKKQTSLMMDQAAHAAEAGADAVVLHHPHVASPIVVVPTKDGRKVPIFASVGNLVTNQGESWKPPMFPVLRDNRRLVCVNGWTRLGVLADLSFDFGEGGAMTLDWRSHLVWIENEHADDRNVMVPHIAARLIDPERDKGLVAKLSEDRRGPVALFDDPCWAARGSNDPTRCVLHRTHAPSAPPPSEGPPKRPQARFKKGPI